MGSAIGDYIHYSALGYDNSGTTLRGEYRKPVYGYITSKINEYINRTSSGASPEELKEFGDMLTAFMNNPQQFAKGAEAKEALEKHLIENFKEEMEKAVLNFDNMTASGLDTKNALGKVSGRRAGKGRLSMDLKEITNKINKIEEVYLKKMNQKTVNTREFRELRAAYKDLVGKSAKRLKKYDFRNNPHQLKLEGSYKDIGELRSRLNALIEEYASYPAIVGVEDLAFEDAIALLPYVAEETAYASAMEAIEAGLVGNKNAKVEQYNENKFAMKSIHKQLGNNTFLDTTYNQRSKIDVELSWKENDYKISAKNVSFGNTHTWIDVTSGNPLLSLVQDLDTNFVNHWINIHAIHGISSKAAATGKEVNDAMKSFILYKGMTGNAFNRDLSDNANLFIINDKTKKNGVIVKDMQQVFNKALQSLNAVSVKINGTPINAMKLKNEWNDKSYAERLTSVLAEMHALKVEAMFNANVVLK